MKVYSVQKTWHDDDYKRAQAHVTTELYDTLEGAQKHRDSIYREEILSHCEGRSRTDDVLQDIADTYFEDVKTVDDHFIELPDIFIQLEQIVHTVSPDDLFDIACLLLKPEYIYVDTNPEVEILVLDVHSAGEE